MPKNRGIGAKCSIQKRHLHSAEILKDFPEWNDIEKNGLIPGWTIVGTGWRVTDRKKRNEVECALVTNPLFKHPREAEQEYFYCAVNYARVDEEGPKEQFFPKKVQMKKKQGQADITEVAPHQPQAGGNHQLEILVRVLMTMRSSERSQVLCLHPHV